MLLSFIMKLNKYQLFVLIGRAFRGITKKRYSTHAQSTD